MERRLLTRKWEDDMTPDVGLANWFLQWPLRSNARSYSSLWVKKPVS